MKADWGKGYARKGAALHGLGQFDASIAAYEEGLKVEPVSRDAEEGAGGRAGARRSRGGGAGGIDGLANVFGAPDLIPRMAANPQTAGFAVRDPGFMAKLEEIRRDPNAMTKHMSDQRVLTVMGMMMGIDIQSGRAAATSGAGLRAALAQEGAAGRMIEKELTPEEKERSRRRPFRRVQGPGERGVQGEECSTRPSASSSRRSPRCPTRSSIQQPRGGEVRAEGLRRPCIRQVQEGDRGSRCAPTSSWWRRRLRGLATRTRRMDKLAEAIRAYEDSLMEDRTPDVEKRLKDGRRRCKKAETEAYVNPEKARWRAAGGQRALQARGKFRAYAGDREVRRRR